MSAGGDTSEQVKGGEGMDASAMPMAEREEALRRMDCPYCHAKAGYLCRTSSGESYPSAADVHSDRLIALYRDAFLATDRDKHRAAVAEGWNIGWQDGVVAAQEALTELMERENPNG
ncbi:hypothetical protein Q9R29_08485 [Rothia sp. ARF10]|nr:hypothetical protein [Rothia sp. ARF10]